MTMDPVTELEALIDAFDADEVPYALCGGLALAVHGFPRQTKDIDILLAVARRLDEVRELFRLTEYLSKFRPVKQEKPSQKSDRR